MDIRLNGKVAVVTGAAMGIGLSCAKVIAASQVSRSGTFAFTRLLSMTAAPGEVAAATPCRILRSLSDGTCPLRVIVPSSAFVRRLR